MKVYKSKSNIKLSDYYGRLALWCVAIVVTLGFAAIPFQLWLIKVILDNWEIEVEERKHECDAYIDTMALLDAEAESKDKE